MSSMTAIERLYYALGEVAYAIAKADGTIQREEKEKLHAILKEEFAGKQNIDISEIIFQVLQKEGMPAAVTYEWALKEMRLNSQYVSEPMKEHFVHVLKKVAAAFPPVTRAERDLIDDFIYQLKSIKGDPIFSKETE